MSSANVSVWFEIPARDLVRAKRFYDSVFEVSLKLEDFGPHQLAVFPGQPGQNGGCLIHGEGYEASGRATTIYLVAGDDLAAGLEALARGNPGFLVAPEGDQPKAGTAPTDLPAGRHHVPDRSARDRHPPQPLQSDHRESDRHQGRDHQMVRARWPAARASPDCRKLPLL